MFYNMGKKIQSLAVTLCWIGIGIFIISGLVAIYLGFASHTLGLIALGILVLILGPLFSWLSIFVLYAFGELVENVQDITDQLYQIEYSSQASSPNPAPIPEPEPETESEQPIEPAPASKPDDAPNEKENAYFEEKYFSKD